MEENNNQQQPQQAQQYQQYQAPQQPQGAPQGNGNQFFQGFTAPNTEDGLKKKFADLKTIFLILGILAAIGVIIDLVTVIPTIKALNAVSSLSRYLVGSSVSSGLVAILIIAVIIDVAFCAVQWVGMIMAKKEDKKALILGIIAGGLELLIVLICLIAGAGFKWFNAIMGGALIADCIITLNAYKAVRGNK